MLLEILGVAALLFGLFFCAVGVLGVIRMPDSLTRLHASGKVATLGLFGLLVGAALLMPSTWLRFWRWAYLFCLTSPVATHAIAASVYRRREIVEELAETDDQAESTDFTSSGCNRGAVALTNSRYYRRTGARAPPSCAGCQDKTRHVVARGSLSSSSDE